MCGDKECGEAELDGEMSLREMGEVWLPFIGAEGWGGVRSMAARPVAINGGHFSLKEKWRAGEMGSQGGGRFAVSCRGSEGGVGG
jgi:hypothetical protein